MKKTFTLMLLCMMGLIGYAQTEGILLKLQDGTTVGFAYTENPTITFDATDMVVTCEGQAAVSYPLEGLSLTFGQIATQVQNIQSADIIFTLSGDAVVATGLNAGQQVTATAVGGTLVASAKADQNGQATLSLQGKQGVIIIQTGKVTYKIIKK